MACGDCWRWPSWRRNPIPVPSGASRFPPHQVIGNVYFVGSVNLGSYLITTPEGHILVNTDFEETVPVIRARGAQKLGFKFTDIKIILGSHAHGDHMEATPWSRN